MELDVVFRNEEHQKLIGKFSTPNLPKGSYYPCVILCHGFNVNKDLFFLPDLAKALLKRNIAVLRFDARGCGSSEGDHHPSYKELTNDILAAINYIAKNEDVEFIGIAGHSMGGTASLLAGSHEEVSAVASFGAVQDVEKIVQEKKHQITKKGEDYLFKGKYGNFILQEAFFTDTTTKDVMKATKNLRKPILLVHGTNDSRVPIEQGMHLFMEASMPKKFTKISNSDHWFEHHYDELISTTVQFFEKHLLPEEE